MGGRKGEGRALSSGECCGMGVMSKNEIKGVSLL
jgi:hypothetical protein